MLQNLFDSIRNSGQPILIGFADSQDVFNNFQLSQDAREGLEIIYANYECGDYDGSATVFFYSSNTGKYHEAYGSHCSCYGLEDQWGMEEINFKELENRLIINQYFGVEEFRNCGI